MLLWYIDLKKFNENIEGQVTKLKTLHSGNVSD
jgi:hypothetical protein